MNHTQYVPILKWKQGEYQALFKTKDEVKKRICPLIELTPISYDFEKNRMAKTMDEHLQDFGATLKKKWGVAPVFLDVACVKYSDGEKHKYAQKTFEDCRNCGCAAIPVVSLKEDASCLQVYKDIIAQDKRGFALRIKLDDFGPELGLNIKRVLDILCVGMPDADLIVDFQTSLMIGIGNEQTTFEILREKCLNVIPYIALWRSFIVAGSSFPDDLNSLVVGENMNDRRLEWLFYKDCMNVYKSSGRVPTFADYVVSTPEHKENMDMRLIKPCAKLRYTFDDVWYYNRGRAVRGKKSLGFDQYKDMCKSLIGKPGYRHGLSEGDDFIFNCANGGNTGNLSTWVWVSTNQHIAKVVFDLSKLYGFLI